MQRYYKQIHDMPPLSEQEMNAHLAEESRVRRAGLQRVEGGAQPVRAPVPGMGSGLQSQCPARARSTKPALLWLTAGVWEWQGTQIGCNQLLIRCWKEQTKGYFASNFHAQTSSDLIPSIFNYCQSCSKHPRVSLNLTSFGTTGS